MDSPINTRDKYGDRALVPKPLNPRPRPPPNTAGNPPQPQSRPNKVEIVSTSTGRPVTNDPKPRPKPPVVNAPFTSAVRETSNSVGQSVGREVGVGLGVDVVDFGDLGHVGQEHVMLFQDRNGEGEEGKKEEEPKTPVIMQGPFWGGEDEKMGGGK